MIAGIFPLHHTLKGLFLLHLLLNMSKYVFDLVAPPQLIIFLFNMYLIWQKMLN